MRLFNRWAVCGTCHIHDCGIPYASETLSALWTSFYRIYCPVIVSFVHVVVFTPSLCTAFVCRHYRRCGGCHGITTLCGMYSRCHVVRLYYSLSTLSLVMLFFVVVDVFVLSSS